MKYEAWEDDSEEGLSYSFFPAENREKHMAFMSKDAKLLHVIEADSFDEARTKYYEIMGWKPYKPMDYEEPVIKMPPLPEDC